MSSSLQVHTAMSPRLADSRLRRMQSSMKNKLALTNMALRIMSHFQGALVRFHKSVNLFTAIGAIPLERHEITPSERLQLLHGRLRHGHADENTGDGKQHAIGVRHDEESARLVRVELESRQDCG